MTSLIYSRDEAAAGEEAMTEKERVAELLKALLPGLNALFGMHYVMPEP
jgi:hypothetical protein